MCQLGCVDQVADRIDARLTGPAVLVDLDETPLVDDDAGPGEAETVYWDDLSRNPENGCAG